MFEIVEDEFEYFLKDMENGESFCRYIDEDEYEDEYSHNDIDELQSEFTNKVRTWLRENRPDQYIVLKECWCVFVLTIEEAKKRKFNYWENWVV